MHRIVAAVALVGLFGLHSAPASHAESQDASPDPGEAPWQRDPWVVGPILMELGFGDDLEFPVLASGRVDDDRLLVVVRNTTTRPIREVNIIAEARDASGRLFAVGEAGGPGLMPPVIESDAIGFGVIGFDGVALPPDIGFEFTWSGYREDGGQYSHQNIRIDAIEKIQDRFVGEVSNEGPETVESASVEILCFDASGDPEGIVSDSVPAVPLPVEAGGSFQVTISPELDCSGGYLAAARGVDF